jgi:Fe-S cluster biogenesis protein NfuA
MTAQPDFQQRLKSIERLLGEIEAAADPNLRATAQELVQLVMDLHGAGLERMLELIRSSDEGVVEKLGRDELVASLLILYGLHPVDLETRVAQALEKARVRLRPHEGEVELLGIQEGVVRLRIHLNRHGANGHGCGSTPEALKEIVESAIYQAAPDVASMLIEDPKPSLVQIGIMQGAVL